MPDGSPEARQVVVRVGKPEDLDAVMRIARLAAAEGALLDYEEGVALQTIYECLHLHNGIMGVIDGENGELEGTILMRIGPPWSSTTQFIEERSIFVHPDFRKSNGKRARRLIEFAKWTAQRLELKLLIGVLSNERTAAKVRLYERVFGKPAGSFWLYSPHEEVTGGTTDT
jgi:hypothetical protein